MRGTKSLPLRRPEGRPSYRMSWCRVVTSRPALHCTSHAHGTRARDRASGKSRRSAWCPRWTRRLQCSAVRRRVRQHPASRRRPAPVAPAEAAAPPPMRTNAARAAGAHGQLNRQSGRERREPGARTGRSLEKGGQGGPNGARRGDQVGSGQRLHSQWVRRGHGRSAETLRHQGCQARSWQAKRPRGTADPVRSRA